MEDNINIIINNINYVIINTIEYITIADSFIFSNNKIGTGHGEAKLYVGNENDEIINFFGDFNLDCFLKKSDLNFLFKRSREEFLHPDQNYVHKNKMSIFYQEYKSLIESQTNEILSFRIFRSNVEPPRVYINSDSDNYNIIRKICLPNISYLSIMKLQDDNGNIKLYFRPFIDYNGRINNRQLEEIKNDDTISEIVKDTISKARIGQGKYREKLLENCPICPITLVSDERLLISSHIKPWSKSDNNEKVDPMNGFMFTPTYDKLFDIGFMTFDDDGKMIVSNWVSKMTQNKLGIYSGKTTSIHQYLTTERIKYLQYHRENIFKK